MLSVAGCSEASKVNQNISKQADYFECERKITVYNKNTGEDAYFEIQISNEDPTSAVGRQTVVLQDCNIDGGILAKFDADSSDYLDEEMSFTFEDFTMPETFSALNGFLTN